MKYTKYFLSLILLIFLNKTYACSCAEDKQLSLRKMVHSEYEDSELIFVGKVMDIEDTNKDKRKSTMDFIVYTFRIKKIYKGEIQTKFIKVKSHRDGTSCGFIFKRGITYLVYSDLAKFPNATNLQTDICKRNQMYDNVNTKEINLLNRRSKVQINHRSKKVRNSFVEDDKRFLIH